MKVSLTETFQSLYGLEKLIEVLQCTANPKLPNRVRRTVMASVYSACTILMCLHGPCVLLPVCGVSQRVMVEVLALAMYSVSIAAVNNGTELAQQRCDPLRVVD